MTSSAGETTDGKDRQLATQLADARLRLRAELDAMDQPIDTVNSAFDSAAARLATARVHSFLPILIERAVRRHFDHDADVQVGAGRQP